MQVVRFCCVEPRQNRTIYEKIKSVIYLCQSADIIWIPNAFAHLHLWSLLYSWEHLNPCVILSVWNADLCITVNKWLSLLKSHILRWLRERLLTIHARSPVEMDNRMCHVHFVSHVPIYAHMWRAQSARNLTAVCDHQLRSPSFPSNGNMSGHRWLQAYKPWFTLKSIAYDKHLGTVLKGNSFSKVNQ